MSTSNKLARPFTSSFISTNYKNVSDIQLIRSVNSQNAVASRTAAATSKNFEYQKSYYNINNNNLMNYNNTNNSNNNRSKQRTLLNF